MLAPNHMILGASFEVFAIPSVGLYPMNAMPLCQYANMPICIEESISVLNHGVPYLL